MFCPYVACTCVSSTHSLSRAAMSCAVLCCAVLCCSFGLALVPKKGEASRFSRRTFVDFCFDNPRLHCPWTGRGDEPSNLHRWAEGGENRAHKGFRILLTWPPQLQIINQGGCLPALRPSLSAVPGRCVQWRLQPCSTTTPRAPGQSRDPLFQFTNPLPPMLVNACVESIGVFLLSPVNPETC